jgi:hypothetical protein
MLERLTRAGTDHTMKQMQLTMLIVAAFLVVDQPPGFRNGKVAT